MIIWLILGGMILIYELLAIVFDKWPTLSELIWAQMEKSKFRRILIRLFLLWLIIHLWFGECAFGLCCEQRLDLLCFWR